MNLRFGILSEPKERGMSDGDAIDSERIARFSLVRTETANLATEAGSSVMGRCCCLSAKKIGRISVLISNKGIRSRRDVAPTLSLFVALGNSC